MNLIVLNNIKEIRKKLHLNTRDLAELSELSNSTISNIENGKNIPSQLSMMQIARALDMEVCEIFSVDPNILDAYFGRNSDHS